MKAPGRYRVHIGTEKAEKGSLHPLSAAAEGKIASQSMNSLDGVWVGGTSQGTFRNSIARSGNLCVNCEGSFHVCGTSALASSALCGSCGLMKSRSGAGAGICDTGCVDIVLTVDVSLERLSASGGTVRLEESKEFNMSSSHLRMIWATCRSSCCSTGPGRWPAVVTSSCCTRLSNSRRKRRESSLGELLS